MKSNRVLLLGLCCMWLLTGCEAQITAHVMATLTAAAPTGTPAPTATSTLPPTPTDTPVPGGEPKDYAGTFRYGFEVIAFKPCNSDEVWWLNGDGAVMTELRTRYEALTQKMEPVYVRLRGLISERGFYGHMGGYQREFYLKAVLDVRDLQPGDCR